MEKDKELTFFDFIKSIQDHKYILDDNNQKLYLKFLVNNVLAGELNLLSVVNFVLNINAPHFSNKMHYDFLFYSGLLKKNKFYKYKFKNPGDSEDIELVSDIFQENPDKVKDYLEFIPTEELKKIKKERKNAKQR